MNERRRVGPERFSERAFHLWLSRALRRRSDPLPMGDDVAAVRTDGALLLLTTDALSEGTHFLPRSPPEAVGAAAIGASLSDIASKGGRPMAALLDLLLPPTTPPAWARAVVRGAEAFSRRYGFHVVGGDTKPSSGRSVVGTVVGRATTRRLPSHEGARPGDRLVVTGRVGSGGARAIALDGDRPSVAALRDLLRIAPRLAEGRALAPLAHAMVDSSDGFAAATRRLSAASGRRIQVDGDALPLDPHLRKISDPARRFQVAMYGGDYELVAAIPARSVRTAIEAVRAAGGEAKEIGTVASGRGAWVRLAGRWRALPVEGWDPFRPARVFPP